MSTSKYVVPETKENGDAEDQETKVDPSTTVVKNDPEKDSGNKNGDDDDDDDDDDR